MFRASLGHVAWQRRSLVQAFVPRPWRDLASSTPNLEPFATKGYFIGTLRGIYFLDPPGGLTIGTLL